MDDMIVKLKDIGDKTADPQLQSDILAALGQVNTTLTSIDNQAGDHTIGLANIQDGVHILNTQGIPSLEARLQTLGALKGTSSSQQVNLSSSSSPVTPALTFQDVMNQNVSKPPVSSSSYPLTPGATPNSIDDLDAQIRDVRDQLSTKTGNMKAANNISQGEFEKERKRILEESQKGLQSPNKANKKAAIGKLEKINQELHDTTLTPHQMGIFSQQLPPISPNSDLFGLDFGNTPDSGYGSAFPPGPTHSNIPQTPTKSPLSKKPAANLADSPMSTLKDKIQGFTFGSPKKDDKKGKAKRVYLPGETDQQYMARTGDIFQAGLGLGTGKDEKMKKRLALLIASKEAGNDSRLLVVEGNQILAHLAKKNKISKASYKRFFDFLNG
jgi:hypothetical protein